MQIKPIGTYLLIQKYKKPEEKRLIINPNEKDEFPHQGIIVKAGINCVYSWNEGDRIRYTPYIEQHIDQDLFLIKEESIMAVIEE